MKGKDKSKRSEKEGVGSKGEGRQEKRRKQ
jgi:hypothetical protein